MIRQHDEKALKWMDIVRACGVPLHQRLYLVGQKSATAIEEIGREEPTPCGTTRDDNWASSARLSDSEGAQ